MIEKKLKTLSELEHILPHTYLPEKVVFTSGVFDILHPAHFRYLDKAKSLGYTLVVGIHGDDLVKRRKGDPHPYLSAVERAENLSFFHKIDYLVILETQEEIYRAIRDLKLNTVVVSETTKDIGNCPETMKNMFGETTKVVVLEPQSERHSSDILRVIQQA